MALFIRIGEVINQGAQISGHVDLLTCRCDYHIPKRLAKMTEIVLKGDDRI